MRRLAASVLALAAMTTLAAALPPLQSPRLTREAMEGALGPGARFLVVYGTRRAASTAALRETAARIARVLGAGDSAAARADRDVPAESLAAQSVVLVGSAGENLWTERLAAALPVAFTPRGFHWADKDYERPGDRLNLVYPNPLAPATFLLLVAANSPAALESRGAFFFGDADWRIERDGELLRSGRFAQSAAAPWHYDPALDHDLDRERERFAAGLARHVAHGVEWLAPPGERRADDWAHAASDLLARMDAQGFAAPEARPVRVTSYPSLEDKGRLTRNTRPEHVATPREAAVALIVGRRSPDLWSVAALRLVALGAAASSPWLEPAGAWWAGRWGGEPLERAIARAYFARLLPTAREAASRGDGWRSPLLLVPARAALARSIMECAPARHGAARAALLALLGTAPPGDLDSLCRGAGVEAPKVERRYAALVDSLARAGQSATGAPAPRPWRPADGFVRGVCLAHSVSLERGYLSASCAGELQRLRTLGANWVSLSPFGFVPGAGAPDIAMSADGGPDEETDESVAEAAARARALGLRVLLAPHLWSRGWTGSLEFGTAGWPRFFACYREFLIHYALLAEREGMDGLVIGHELGSATARDPGRWRALAGEVRRVYGGTLTYSANWDHEAEAIGFWDSCDLIGVSFYDPLATAPGATQESMTAAARRALASRKALARRTGRPVLLTEAGYPATPTAALRPWEENRRGVADPEAQRACYDALLTALDSEDWVAGLFVWKWFTAPPAPASADRSYSPAGKPAESVLVRAYSGWRDRPVRVLPRSGP